MSYKCFSYKITLKTSDYWHKQAQRKSGSLVLYMLLQFIHPINENAYSICLGAHPNTNSTTQFSLLVCMGRVEECWAHSFFTVLATGQMTGREAPHSLQHNNPITAYNHTDTHIEYMHSFTSGKVFFFVSFSPTRPQTQRFWKSRSKCIPSP